MSTIDASQCWRIMPFEMFDGEEDEWWVLGPDHEPVDGGIVPTREQAFAMALEHNKAYGVNAVYVYTTSSMNKGNRQQPPTTMMTPEPPVEILLRCWHILPVTPDEGGAETWWVLGQNNTVAQEPSTVGPFSTKEEAFAIALEHNKAYGINAVYVHGRREKDGEIAGDFEGPSLTSFEQAIIKVGDQAMKNVLKNNEQSPNAEIWEQMDKDFEDYKKKMAEGAYPEAENVEEQVRKKKEINPDAPEEYLRKWTVSAIAATKRLNKEFFPVDPFEDPPSPETVAVVQKSWHHFVVSLGDDDDGGDTVTPLYFGWTEHHNERHDNMIGYLDRYFEAVCALCEQFDKEGPRKRKAILNHVKKLPSTEAAILRQAMKILDDHPSPREDDDTIPTLLFELGPQLKIFFTELFLQSGGSSAKTNYRIDSGPWYNPLEWTGTHYWAEDAGKCIRCIIQESRKATDRLQKLVQKGLA